MFSIEVMFFIAVICFVVGVGIGVLISRTWVPPQHQQELERSLQEARSDLEQYQQNVAKHFVETSQRISHLTDSYKGLHEHLAQGATHFTSSEVSQQMLQTEYKPTTNDPKVVDSDFKPPKDWAPKTPGQTGILSEEFGLAETKEEPGIETTGLQTANKETST